MDSWLQYLIGDGAFFLAYILKPVFIVGASLLLRWVCDSALMLVVAASQKAYEGPLAAKRQETIKSLLRNMVKYATSFIAVVMVLDCFHVPVMAILSTVGIVGVAVGFGAQSLCKDVITGFFILLENQYNVGEYIEAQGVEGFVEQFTMRCTYLRDFDGRLHIMPNGGMGLVTNHHRGSRRVMVEINIAYDRDIGEAIRLLQEACDRVNEANEDIIRERIVALGVVDMGASGMKVRMLGKAETMTQWKVERELRKSSIETLRRAGIDIPYPHSQIVMASGIGGGGAE